MATDDDDGKRQKVFQSTSFIHIVCKQNVKVDKAVPCARPVCQESRKGLCESLRTAAPVMPVPSVSSKQNFNIPPQKLNIAIPKFAYSQ